MRIDAKISARQWILNAIQNHSCIPNKETEREIRKFVERLQRDLRQLTRSRDLFIALNSEDVEEKNRAIHDLGEQPKGKGKSRKWRRREAQIIQLVKSQSADLHDRKIRFEHAISRQD